MYRATYSLHFEKRECGIVQGRPNFRWARESCKWGADFLVKALVGEDKYLLHIGDIPKDHSYLGHAEDYPQIDRNILYCGPGEDSPSLASLACACRPYAHFPHCK